MKVTLTIVLLFVALASWTLPGMAGDVVEVKIEKMEFVPQNLKIRAGTTVSWMNMEKRNNHSVYFEKEGLPESDRLFPGESWQRVFEKPGIFPYICGPHPEMTGTVEVEP